MAGIYTQKRVLRQPGQWNVNSPGAWECFFRLNPGWGINNPNTITRVYYQTTTSFRSRDPSGQEFNPTQLIVAARDQVQRPYDRGHEFATTKGSYKLSRGEWRYDNPNGAFWRGYLDTIVAGDPFIGSTRDYTFSPIDLQYGTKAIKFTAPTKEAANLSQLLVETLRDVPKLPGMAFVKGPLGAGGGLKPLNKRGLASSTGEEYLNLVFGWQPTVSDVLKICESIVYADDIISQYVRDSGRIVRRRFDFPSSTTKRLVAVDKANIPAGIDSLLGDSWYQNFFVRKEDAVGIATVTEEVTERYYFAGAYSYYLADVSSPEGVIARTAQIARKLLGIKGLTPDLMWELLPFSWLADWFGNVGDILTNASRFQNDNLVLRWGYLMRHTDVARYTTHSGITFRGGARTGPFSGTERFSQKLRVKATPYGFGLNPNGFSANQWAILAALGMTKSDRTLL